MKEVPVTTLALAPERTVASAWSVRDVYLQHGDFIWRCLQQLGIWEVDLDDCLQEVLLVVHRRLDSYDPDRAKVTTWLFGICLRIAKRHRRRAASRRETCVAKPAEQTSNETPEQQLVRRQAQQQLMRLLDRMTPEKRATFVLFELEGMQADQIAELMGVPVGTVHSRLHGARKQFVRDLARQQSRIRRQHG